MRMQLAVSLTLSAMCVPTSAQSIVDGTGSALKPGELSELYGSVTRDLRDPSSVQFRRLREVGDFVCGEVNAKNGFGAYVGFRPFGFAPAKGSAVIFDPASDPRDFANEEMIRTWGCYDDGSPETEWKGLSKRALACISDLELLAQSQGPEPVPGGRDFNELFSTVRECAVDRLIPRKLAERYGLL